MSCDVSKEKLKELLSEACIEIARLKVKHESLLILYDELKKELAEHRKYIVRLPVSSKVL